MQAIITKYHPCTNTKGSRISAKASGGHKTAQVSIPYPHELSGEDCHRKAAELLCTKMSWNYELIGGATKDGYVFVMVRKGANTQVIDAAPDLLNMLQRLRDEIKMTECGMSHVAPLTLEQVDKAIDKAGVPAKSSL